MTRSIPQASRWHTDRKVGEIVTFPNGTRARVVWIRSRRVRLEYINPVPDRSQPPGDVKVVPP